MLNLNYNVGGGAIAAAMHGVRWFGFEARRELREVMIPFVLSNLGPVARLYNHYEDFGHGNIFLYLFFVSSCINCLSNSIHDIT